jgi:cytoskeleton protein RodZ
LLVAVVLLLATYGGWVFMSSPNEEPAEIELSLPERLAPFVSKEMPNMAPPSVESGEKVTTNTSSETSSSPIAENASNPEQAPNPKPIAAAPKKAAVVSGAVHSIANTESMPREHLAEGQLIEGDDRKRVYGGSRVVIRASEDSWVEIRNGSGELLLTRVLREGENYHVPNQSGLTLVTGNAGALKFSVDGEDVSDIGPPGTVRRNVLLDPQALKNGLAHSR